MAIYAGTYWTKIIYYTFLPDKIADLKMARKFFVGGNWKMNGNKESIDKANIKYIISILK